MNRASRGVISRFLTIFLALGVLGIASTVYVLVKERAVLPFQDVYTLHVRFAEASGVSGGVGQPVNVVGVKVGQVTGIELDDGVAVATIDIDRDKLRHVYADAHATLEPITPLKDMQINLDPGAPPAAALPDGGVIGLDATRTPVALSSLLSRLDADTRTYLSSLIAGLDRGTAGRADDLRRTLAALGPTAAQAGRLSASLAARRRALARLVHNLAIVDRAAVGDGQLRRLIVTANRTLGAVASQDRPLRAALRELPGTLDATADTLTRVGPFANALRPTLGALTPSVRRLPRVLEGLQQLSDRGTPVLRTTLRPFVRDARPVARRLSSAVPDLRRASPDLIGVAKTLNYALNELAYNPPGDDEGMLFWTAWGLHNLNSALSTGDANGTVLRGSVLAPCASLRDRAVLRPLLNILDACPK